MLSFKPQRRLKNIRREKANIGQVSDTAVTQQLKDRSVIKENHYEQQQNF